MATAAEQRRWRQRARERGLVEVRVVVPRGYVNEIKALAADLRRLARSLALDKNTS